MDVKQVIIHMNTLELSGLEDADIIEENCEMEGLAGLNGSEIYLDEDIAKVIVLTPNYLIIVFKPRSGYDDSHWVIPKERIGRMDIRGTGDLKIDTQLDEVFDWRY